MVIKTLTGFKPRVRVKLKTLAQIAAASTTCDVIYVMGCLLLNIELPRTDWDIALVRK
jgi:hypothetical protein